VRVRGVDSAARKERDRQRQQGDHITALLQRYQPAFVSSSTRSRMKSMNGPPPF